MARAALDRGMRDWARAVQASTDTVSRHERGEEKARTVDAIRRALEDAGAEFVAGEGVRLQPTRLVASGTEPPSRHENLTNQYPTAEISDEDGTGPRQEQAGTTPRVAWAINNARIPCPVDRVSRVGSLGKRIERNSRRAGAAPIRVTPTYRTGDPVRWKDRVRPFPPPRDWGRRARGDHDWRADLPSADRRTGLILKRKTGIMMAIMDMTVQSEPSRMHRQAGTGR